MADAYSFPVLVELEENNVPKVKVKLLKYFNSKKSGGGDCEVDYVTGSHSATLRFRTELEQRNVLQRDTHQIPVDQGLLKMTLRSPTAQKTPAVPVAAARETQKRPSDDVTKECAAKVQVAFHDTDDIEADEEQDSSSSSVVVKNISADLSEEFLELLVVNVLKDNSSRFTLELLRHISSAVVTFQSAKESTEFLSRYPHNAMFRNKKLTAQPLEVTREVLVEDLKNMDQDLIQLCFDNTFGTVENVVLNKAEHSAVVTFKDSRAFQAAVQKKTQAEMSVYPYYPSLGGALYGSDRSAVRLPPAVSVAVDGAVCKYLRDHAAAERTVHAHLAKHFCDVKLEQSSVCLSPSPSILRRKDATAMAQEWSGGAEAALTQALARFKCLKLRPEPQVWEECYDGVRAIVGKQEVGLGSDQAAGELSVVGFVDDVNGLEQSLVEAVAKINRRAQREKATKTQDIKVSPSIFHLLHQKGLQAQLQQLHPELQMSYSKEGQGVCVTGVGEEILEANRMIYDAIIALKRVTLGLDPALLDLLKADEQEELTNVLLLDYGINAAFEMSAHRVEVLAFSDQDLTRADDHLKNLLMCQNIDVEDASVLQKPEWQALVSSLERDHSKHCRRLRILSSVPKVVASGHRNVVGNVSVELENFLLQNATVEESVVAKPNVVLQFIKKYKQGSLDRAREDVAISYRQEAVCLSGSRANVTTCRTMVEKLVQSLHFDTLNISKHRVTKFFRDNETMYLNCLLNDTGCLVELQDEAGPAPTAAQSQSSDVVYQTQTPDGVEIAVCKADLCSYPVDAVVNSANDKLQHGGGLSLALLTAAGPQLQVESDKIINSRGKLRAGDCVMTDGGGRLSCRKIIHAVGPVFDANRPHKSLLLLKKAVMKSLELAEKENCPTVAVPAISRTQGFPLDRCALTIATAVKEHCDQMFGDSKLKKIHLVNIDDQAVQEMKKAVQNSFGSGGTGVPGDLAPQAGPQLVPQAGASPRSSLTDPNCLAQVTTAEGLDITLTKGNIQQATVDVIVNTAAEDLVLNRGAVSSAILSAAGPNLQQLINAQGSGASVGDVIVTDGCQLRSKKVFHAIAPGWDQKPSTKGILSGIFKDCLERADDSRLSSLALPAIGTGNLGFPRDLVATLLLNEISAFSLKQPQQLKQVVIILYPGDTQTIQVFSDEFLKHFPGASVGAAATTSAQNTGPFSNVSSSAGMHEATVGGVSVQVVTGDITKETSDVIVNSSNDTFSLKSGVSKAILDAAGPSVEGECQTLGALPSRGMILTGPGNLRCKKILHVIGQSDPAKIQQVVTKALDRCAKDSFTSVSLPAIGTGQGNVQARQVADAMFDAVIDALNQNPGCSLTTIRIVVFQAPMLKEFVSSLQSKGPGASSSSSSSSFTTLANIGNRIKSFFSGASVDKQPKDKDFVIPPLAVAPARFHICGDSQANVASAKRWLVDRVAQHQSTNTIAEPVILSFSQAEQQRIVHIQTSKGVSIGIQNQNGQASLTIEGFSNDVVEATKDVQALLKKLREDHDLKKQVEQAAAKADWQYQPATMRYQSFDPLNNFKLEDALSNNLTSVQIDFQGQSYTVALPEGPATDRQGNTLHVKRVDKLRDDVPPHWDTMPPNVPCLAVALKSGSTEYNDILQLFTATCPRPVTKIERIQNPSLWRSVQIKKRDMELRNGHKNNERRLFHGTTHDIVSTISEHGFNRSYAGKNAACYGNGTYFAVDASYSAQDTYSRPNASGEKVMYLCQVLTGDFTRGQQNMIVPPAKSSTSAQKFDSVVDNISKPHMFVIFHDTQACPEYLITFK